MAHGFKCILLNEIISFVQSSRKYASRGSIDFKLALFPARL